MLMLCDIPSRGGRETYITRYRVKVSGRTNEIPCPLTLSGDTLNCAVIAINKYTCKKITCVCFYNEYCRA